jgi:hypothetical protein
MKQYVSKTEEFKLPTPSEMQHAFDLVDSANPLRAVRVNGVAVSKYIEPREPQAMSEAILSAIAATPMFEKFRTGASRALVFILVQSALAVASGVALAVESTKTSLKIMGGASAVVSTATLITSLIALYEFQVADRDALINSVVGLINGVTDVEVTPQFDMDLDHQTEPTIEDIDNAKGEIATAIVTQTKKKGWDLVKDDDPIIKRIEELRKTGWCTLGGHDPLSVQINKIYNRDPTPESHTRCEDQVAERRCKLGTIAKDMNVTAIKIITFSSDSVVRAHFGPLVPDEKENMITPTTVMYFISMAVFGVCASLLRAGSLKPSDLNSWFTLRRM